MNNIMSNIFSSKKVYDVRKYNFYFADDDDFSTGYEALLPLPMTARSIVVMKKTHENCLQDTEIRKLFVAVCSQKKDTASLHYLIDLFGQIATDRMRDADVEFSTNYLRGEGEDDNS